MDKPKVYVPQDLTNVFLANLHEYGKLTFIWSRKVRKVDFLDESIEATIDKINFDPEVDFFAISGKVGLSCVILGTLVAKYGFVRALIFQGKPINRYALRTIGEVECYDSHYEH